MYPPQPQGEQLLHQDAVATVTTARFMVNGATYPIRGITAVQNIQLPKNYAPSMLAGFGALVLMTYAVIHFDLPPVMLLGAPILGVIVAVITARQTPANYVIRIFTAGGQVDAVRTSDWPRIASISAALNRAIAGG